MPENADERPSASVSALALHDVVAVDRPPSLRCHLRQQGLHANSRGPLRWWHPAETLVQAQTRLRELVVRRLDASWRFWFGAKHEVWMPLQKLAQFALGLSLASGVRSLAFALALLLPLPFHLPLRWSLPYGGHCC